MTSTLATLAIVGAGYVGVTVGACFAELGNDVSVIDIDGHKVRRLQRGQVPFFEPGLPELVMRNVQRGSLRFTTSYRSALRDAGFVFVAVATPEGHDGAADVSAVEAAAVSIAKAAGRSLVLANKSTVPIGTADLVSRAIADAHPQFPIRVVSNPEFLREGAAIRDFMHPDRVIIGSEDPEAGRSLAALYAPLHAPILLTTLYNAEMIKYAANAFLATRISFINEIARISERLGADVKVVAEGIGLDRRIGRHFLDAGLGYGGSCIPKDVKALAAMAGRLRYHPELLHAVIAINDDQRVIPVEKLVEVLGRLRGRIVGLLGLSFKANTDDLRHAPSLDIARLLLRKGATVRAYDPVANAKARALVPRLEVRASPYAIARGADALVLVTEWDEFRQLDLVRLHRLMRRAVIVDGRNLLDPDEVRRAGFVYRGIGRATDDSHLASTATTETPRSKPRRSRLPSATAAAK